MEVAITPEGTFELLYDKMDLIIHNLSFIYSRLILDYCLYLTSLAPINTISKSIF